MLPFTEKSYIDTLGATLLAAQQLINDIKQKGLDSTHYNNGLVDITNRQSLTYTMAAIEALRIEGTRFGVIHAETFERYVNALVKHPCNYKVLHECRDSK